MAENDLTGGSKFPDDTSASIKDVRPSDDDDDDVDPETEAFVASINQTELSSLASSLRKGQPCKVGERLQGAFNVLFHIHFNDGVTWLARFPLPQCPSLRMKSEIATMKYVKERTKIPIPEVYAYDLSSNNPIGAPYMLMNKLPGEMLGCKWDSLSHELKRKILHQIVEILIELSTHRFPQIGSLVLDDSGEFKIGELCRHPQHCLQL